MKSHINHTNNSNSTTSGTNGPGPRQRGRPRKTPLPSSSVPVGTNGPRPSPKTRGRPRKTSRPDGSPPRTQVEDDGIRIDKKFSALMPPLTAEEKELLEKQLRDDGCLKPLVVWEEKNILLDGHHRRELCRANGIKPGIKRISFANRDEAEKWIMEHQLGQRCLSPQAISYFRGKLYGVAKHQGEAAPATSGQAAQKQTTAGKLGQRYHVDERTIRRDSDFAKQLDTLAGNCGTEFRTKVLAGDSALTRGKIKELAELPGGQQSKAVEKAEKKPKASKPTREKSSALDALHKAWGNAKEDDRKAFLSEVLEDDGTLNLFEKIGWDVRPVDE